MFGKVFDAAQDNRLGQALRKTAHVIAHSAIFSKAHRLFAENKQNWDFPLSKLDKLYVGVCMVLTDYSLSKFPPTFQDQAKAYQAEESYFTSLSASIDGGIDAVLTSAARKPFWGATVFKKHADDFGHILRILDSINLPSEAKILEMGCGTGWLSAFLAKSGYHVVGTSIGAEEIAIAERRAAALRVEGNPTIPRFQVAPMETADKFVAADLPFDVVIVYEALHHAFDWRQAIQAAYGCLKPGGVFIICNEPNVLHTFISYRVARLTNTHEIGMSRGAIIRECRGTGFTHVKVVRHRWNNLLSPHWIAARK